MIKSPGLHLTCRRQEGDIGSHSRGAFQRSRRRSAPRALATRHPPRQNAAVIDTLTQWLEGILDTPIESTQPIQPEASFRQFHRLRLAGGDTAIAMFAPPAREDSGRFVRLAHLLHAAGVPVPRIIASDHERGLVLMEDLGTRHFADAYLQGDTERALTTAIDILGTLQRLPPSVVPAYTAQRLSDELEIFTNWFVTGLLGQESPPTWPNCVAALLGAVQSQPVTVVHRDFHCRNLLLAIDGSPGVVDFQDALAGPALYDLASLLRDCYWHFDDDTVRHWLGHYLARTPLHFDDPWQLLDLTALQRQLKAVGIFARLHLRDGKSTHLKYIPPVLEQCVLLAGRNAQTTVLGPWLNQLRVQCITALADIVR